MHMSDALISPAVGGVMLAAGAALTVCSAISIKKEKIDRPEQKTALMGVMGAFVFCAQMVNFTIPGTGSSGHLCGAVLLAALLGPGAGFLTLACVLALQALFFADGGLLAYGCNLFNMGFYACFLAYPLLYRRIANSGASYRRITLAAVLASVVSLQLGALSVVLETLLSGRTQLPFLAFALFMQPIHLAIGLVEGLITAAVLCFIRRAAPDLLTGTVAPRKSRRNALVALAVTAALLGGGFCLMASQYPDGLEWSIANVAGELPPAPEAPALAAAALQEKTAVLPDYNFKNTTSPVGTSAAGLIGGAACCAVILLIGTGVRLVKRGKNRKSV